MNYLLHIIIFINVYIILAVSTNLLVGMANLLSLGQAAFYGTGAYITALALIILKLPLIPTVILAMVVTALISIIIAYSSLRLQGDYFIMATLGFQLIVYTILYNWVNVTRGPYGISGIPSPKIAGLFEISGILPFFVLSTLLAALVVYIIYRLIYSPFGRALRALREDEIALLSLGRNVTTLKIWTFAISSAFIAIAGFIYASYITYIDPTSFNLDEAIFILSAVLIGGLGNIKGPVAGAVFVILMPELLRFVGLPDNVAANLRMVIYGLTLIVLMRYRRKGLAGEFQM